ncbi:immune inhibitor A precursor [Pelomyxa schiedti]|nr:immune inhibitor A precursor [Pelomyxa schiedti]
MRTTVAGVLILAVGVSIVVVALGMGAGAVSPIPRDHRFPQRVAESARGRRITSRFVRNKGAPQELIRLSNRNNNTKRVALVSGTMELPVVTMEFPDQAHTYTNDDFESLLFEHSRTPTPSMWDYYQEVSYNVFGVSGSAYGWYMTPQTKSYYYDGTNLAQLAAENLCAAVGSGLSIYDNDDDGYVDSLVVVHSGQGQEVTGDPDDIWSHSYQLENPYLCSAAGTYIWNYLIQPELGAYGDMTGIGVFCHELGHALGLPDLYDTGDSANNGLGLYRWSLMASGSWGGIGTDESYPVHLDCWCKASLGWLTPTGVLTTGQYTLHQVEDNAECVLLQPLSNPTPSQYWLIENRQRVSFDYNLQGTGIVIYHIDDTIIGANYYENTINTNDHPYGVAFEQASAACDSYSCQSYWITNATAYPATDVWNSNTKIAFGSNTVPSTKVNSGDSYLSCSIRDIPASSSAMTVTLSPEDGVISSSSNSISISSSSSHHTKSSPSSHGDPDAAPSLVIPLVLVSLCFLFSSLLPF